MLGRIYSGTSEIRTNGYLETIVKVPKYPRQSKLNHNNRWMYAVNFKPEYNADNLNIKNDKKKTQISRGCGFLA